MNMHDEHGFTLIELLIVVAILGVITAVAVPNYVNYLYTSKISADISTARQLAQSAYMYCDTRKTTEIPSDFAKNELDMHQSPTSGSAGSEYSYVYDTANHTVIVSFNASKEKAGKYEGYYEVTAYGNIPHPVIGGMNRSAGN